MRAASLAFLLLAAGCTGPALPSPHGVPSPADVLWMDGRAAAAGVPLAWETGSLVFAPHEELACTPSNCDRRVVSVGPLPEGTWVLQVALDWAPTHNGNTGDYDLQYPSFNLTVRGPGVDVQRGGVKFGNVVHIRDPAPGEYTVETRITHMMRDWVLPFFLGQPVPHDPFPVPVSGSTRASVLLHREAPPKEGPLLPDLLVRDLDGLRIEYAPPGQGHAFSPEAWMPGTRGCTVGEHQETGATRCLRFSIGLGNAGEGPLVLSAPRSSDLRVQAEEELGARPMVAVQCVVDGRGNGTVREAGTATYSPSHRHDHFDGILSYHLHAYDLDTRERGAEVATGAKLGYGPWPEALVHDGMRPVGPAWVEDPCGLPWRVGLSPGWYDYYLWWRTSQFIDVEGVPDGVYELVARFNPQGLILESDPSDNEGSVVLRLTGDRVDVLRPFVFHP